MSSTTLNRFEWLKAVLQAENLTPGAKSVASAIAVQFANDLTGQINPSQNTLANYVKLHRDTVKRVLRELRNAGWLMTTGDGGLGKALHLRLLIPGKITRFRPEKKRADRPDREGANRPGGVEKQRGELCEGEGQIIPAHYKEEQSLEQKGQDIPTVPPVVLKQFKQHRFEGRNYDGLILVRMSEWSELNAWTDWLKSRGLPKLYDMPIRQKAEKGKMICFWLPSKKPPTSARGIEDAVGYFQTLQDVEATRYAAQ